MSINYLIDYIKRNRLIFYIFIFSLFTIMIITAIAIHFKEERQIILDNSLFTSKLRYKNAIDSYKKISQVFFDTIVSREEIISLLQKAYKTNSKDQQKIREKILEYMPYEILKKNGLHLTQFHFPDGKSFLRLHKPNIHGDDLTKIRPSIDKMIEEKKFISGFEVGKYYSSYRYIFPIFNLNREYIGSVEVSIPFQVIMDVINNSFSTYNFFIIDKKLIKRSVDTTNKNYFKCNFIEYPYVIEDKELSQKLGIDASKFQMPLSEKVVQSLINNSKDNIKEKLSNKEAFSLDSSINNTTYILSFYPINNIMGQEAVAYIVTIQKSYELMKIHDEHNLLILATIIISFLLIVLFYKIDRLSELRHYNQNLIEAQKRLGIYKKIVSSSEDFMSFMDTNQRYQAVNDTYLKTFQLKEDEVIGKRPYEIMPKEIYKQFVKLSLEKCLKERATQHIATWVNTPNGKRFIRAIYTPYINNSNIMEGIVTNVHDMTKWRLAQDKLQTLTEKLEDKVAEKIEEIREKDKMLIQQSKLASMGEMLSMIAHQWRQPLNVLSSAMIDIQIKKELGSLTNEDIDNIVSKSNKQIQEMSKIIDNFINFFKNEEEKNDFKLIEVFKEIDEIIKPQFLTKDIDINYDGVNMDISIRGYKKEFEHIILSLLSNSKDAFENKQIDNKKVNIEVSKIDGYIIINIKDNAGGIPNEIIDRVFEPYFTTKDEGCGKGVDLYMTKHMIEQNLNGEISVKNGAKGAIFTIKIPLIL